MTARPGPVEAWLGALEKRHLAALTFPEVRRALQALSSLYVERRQKLGTKGALEGAGKRAAFALFYAPIHFLTVDAAVRALGLHDPAPRRILDLGCGTGVAGAAWGLAAGGRTRVEGADENGWAIGEARWNAQRLGVPAAFHRESIADAADREADAIVVAWAANELDDPGRAALLAKLLARTRAGASVLVLEPLARGAAPWWDAWSAAFATAGGRADEWRFTVERPSIVARLDQAARLDHRQLTARTLSVRPAPRR